MSKKTNKNIIELYKCNRQEITFIFTSSMTLFVIAILGGVFRLSSLDKNKLDANEYFVLSILIFLSGLILCYLYKQIIMQGWVNFQIEKELGVQKFGSEHRYFIEGSKFGIIEKYFYRLLCSSYFESNKKIYYHINLKIIILIIFSCSIVSSFMFYQYLSKCSSNPSYINFLFSTTVFFVLLAISFFFFRKEFKTIFKKELKNN